MTAWPSDAIKRIATTDDLHVYPLREDGKTYGTPTWIWSVVVDGHLFVRAYNGTDGRWYQAAIAQRAGRIDAAGATYDVAFAPAEPGLADRIDAAHAEKYDGSSYLPPMVSTRTRAATVEITPSG